MKYEVVAEGPNEGYKRIAARSLIHAGTIIKKLGLGWSGYVVNVKTAVIDGHFYNGKMR